MKKKYIIPEAHIVNVNLFSTLLDEGGYGKYSYGAGGGDDPLYGDAKESAGIEEEEVLPTQPSLWDDDEE